MSFQVGIGSLAGTVFFRWDFVPLFKLWNKGAGSLMLIKGTKRMGWRFSCVLAGMERHSLDLLRAVKNIVGCESGIRN